MRQSVKRHVLIICILGMTIGWMILIFGFSAQSGEESGGLSAIIAEPLTKLLSSFRKEQNPEELAALYLCVDGSVRMAAHFCEYAVLGGLLTLLFTNLEAKQAWLPWLAGTMYALTDEWHQSFSPGRVCDPADVFIDAVGVLCGVFICKKIIHHWRKKHVHHS